MAADSHQWRAYTEVQRAEAVGRALAVGTKQAATELGIPRRTISSWIQAPSAGVRATIVSTREAVAESFWLVISEGTDAMLGRIRDPKTRAGEIAAIVRTAVESHALISGGPTARTETVSTESTLTPDEKDTLRQFVSYVERASDDEIREWAASIGLTSLRDGLHQPKQPEEAADVG